MNTDWIVRMRNAWIWSESLNILRGLIEHLNILKSIIDVKTEFSGVKESVMYLNEASYPRRLLA